MAAPIMASSARALCTEDHVRALAAGPVCAAGDFCKSASAMVTAKEYSFEHLFFLLSCIRFILQTTARRCLAEESLQFDLPVLHHW